MIAPTYVLGTMIVALVRGSSIASMFEASGQHLGVVDGDHLAGAQPHAVLDGRRRGDQREVELAFEALLHDLHVQQAEESAAEPESERCGRLRFEDQ